MLAKQVSDLEACMLILMMLKIGRSRLSLGLLVLVVAVLEVYVLPRHSAEKASLIREVYSFLLGFSVAFIGISGAIWKQLQLHLNEHNSDG